MLTISPRSNAGQREVGLKAEKIGEDDTIQGASFLNPVRIGRYRKFNRNCVRNRKTGPTDNLHRSSIDVAATGNGEMRNSEGKGE